MIHIMSTANCNNECRQSSSKCLSPIALVDPKVRALNTILYGLLIHFGSWWLFGTCNSSNNGSAITNAACETNVNDWYWLRSMLLLHEYWVYLQHTNVLANPYCQRLDRQYGIALLKSNQHWAIAGTLSVRVFAKTNGNLYCLSFIPIQPSHKMNLWPLHKGLLVSRIYWNVSLFAISIQSRCLVHSLPHSLFLNISYHKKSRSTTRCSSSVFSVSWNYAGGY